MHVVDIELIWVVHRNHVGAVLVPCRWLSDAPKTWSINRGTCPNPFKSSRNDSHDMTLMRGMARSAPRSKTMVKRLKARRVVLWNGSHTAPPGYPPELDRLAACTSLHQECGPPRPRRIGSMERLPPPKSVAASARDAQVPCEFILRRTA